MRALCAVVGGGCMLLCFSCVLRPRVGQGSPVGGLGSVSPQVLSFMCEWDDSSRLYGERRLFKLNFYLSDDTIEVNEAPATTRGRGPFTRLLSRQRVPLPGAATIRTYPWAKEKEPKVQVDTAPRTPPRVFRDAIHADCRGEGYCGVLARDRIAARGGAGAGAGSSRPATAGGRPGTARSSASSRPGSAPGNRRPVTAPGPRRMKRSVMDGDDALCVPAAALCSAALHASACRFATTDALSGLHACPSSPPRVVSP